MKKVFRLLEKLDELTGDMYFLMLYSDYSGRVYISKYSKDEYQFSFYGKKNLEGKLRSHLNRIIVEGIA